ncbi:hypothetical protein JCM10908_002384 [Rhodotorula pacifica]|uniref:uncharacterized protein n=1 Tax=Rhodotorula pacifica TaxID=1495444 RepID=UPI00317C21B5
MARSVVSTPLVRGAQPAEAPSTPDDSPSPSLHEAGPTIRAVNPSPAPVKRVLRLSTRAQTPSQLRSLSWTLVREQMEQERVEVASSVNQQEQQQQQLNRSTTMMVTPVAKGKIKSRRIASEPMLSKLYAANRPKRVAVSPAAATARPRTFDLANATADALSSPLQPHTNKRRASSSPQVHAHTRTKKKTRTPRKDPVLAASSAHSHSLVKSMLGLAARTVKALSTTQGRRKFMFGQHNERKARTTRAEKKDTDSAPKTPRAGPSRRQPGSKSASSAAAKHPSSGGASTFRASSSRKRVRVSYGRASLGTVTATTPGSILSTSRVLNRARPVSRSEALVGEYTARAMLRSSVTSRKELGSSMENGKNAREAEDGDEEWVEEDEEERLDEFGMAHPASRQTAADGTSTISYLAHLEQGSRAHFYRSLAPSPISTRTVKRKISDSQRTVVERPQISSAQSSVLSLRDLSRRAFADGSQLLNEDDSTSSPLTALVKQLARAHSSSQDGDVEESDSGLDSPATTDESDAPNSERHRARRPRPFQLPEWLPFATLARSVTGANDAETASKAEEQVYSQAGEPTSPFEDAPEELDADHPSVGLGHGRPAHQVDSADLASARVVGARRLSRELVRKGSLAELRKSYSSGLSGCGTVSAPVSPTSFEDEGMITMYGTVMAPSSASVASPAFPESVGIGLELGDKTLSLSAPTSTHLPSLSPVSPFSFPFAPDNPSSSPLAAVSPPPAPPLAPTQPDDLRKSYRDLTRLSADFPLPPAHIPEASAALRQTALEVFRFPPIDATISGEALRRTIRPGDAATAAAGKKKQARLETWEVFRDEVLSPEGSGGIGGGGKGTASEPEAGVLAERTEASMLRKMASRNRSGVGHARSVTSSSQIGDNEEAEKENAGAYSA